MKTSSVILPSTVAILAIIVMALSVHAFVVQIRVHLLEDAKEVLKANLSIVNASVSELQTSLSSLETKTEIDLDSVNSTIIGLQSMLDACVFYLESLEYNLMNQEDSILELETKIDSLNASLTDLESRLTAIEGEPNHHFRTIRFMDPSEHVLPPSGWTYYNVTKFTWTPDDPTNNAVLSFAFYFEYKYSGVDTTPPMVRADIELDVNDKRADGWTVRAESEDYKWIQVSSREGIMPEPNQEDYVIDFRCAIIDDDPVGLRNINVVIEVIDGLPASN